MCEQLGEQKLLVLSFGRVLLAIVNANFWRIKIKAANTAQAQGTKK
jgi:hypothetical protein